MAYSIKLPAQSLGLLLELEPATALRPIAMPTLGSGKVGWSEYISQKRPSSAVISLPSQPLVGTEATTNNHSDTFEKVKVTITRANVAPKTIMPQLVDVAI